MSLEILKETKVGVTVNKCKKKFSTNNDVGDICKTLIFDWKKVADPQSSSSSSTSTTNVTLKNPDTIPVSASKTESKPLNITTNITSTVATTSSGSTSPRESISPREGIADDGEYDEHYENLHKSRKQVVDILATSLSDATGGNISIARFLSMSIESSLFVAFPWGDNNDSKAYMTKFRSLSFNLKRNEVCVRIIILLSI